MERTLLIARLEAAKRRVRLAQDQVDRQRMVVATLFASGAETTEAENRFRVCEKLHNRYRLDMERILITLKSAIGAPEIELHKWRATVGSIPVPEQSPRRPERQSRQMEHTLLMARLAAAKRRVKLGQDQIDRQRMVVARLFANGADTTEAENRLRVCEKLHDRYRLDMERILIALKSAMSAPEIQPHRLPARVERIPHPNNNLADANLSVHRSPSPFRRALER
jgi:hypothetical protein